MSDNYSIAISQSEQMRRELLAKVYALILSPNWEEQKNEMAKAAVTKSEVFVDNAAKKRQQSADAT